jgi:glycosyltransferase involved in cell wall biosynthesis
MQQRHRETASENSGASYPVRPERGPRATICHLIASGFVGGPEKQILEVSSALVQEGWNVVIGSFRENRTLVELVNAAQLRGIATFLIDTKMPVSPTSVTQLRRHLESHGVRILVTHGYKANLVGALAVRQRPVRQVPIVRGYTAENRKIRLYEALDRFVLRSFTLVACVSEGTRRNLIAYGLCPEQIMVIPNSVGMRPDVAPLDVRAVYGFPPGARVVLAAGRLSVEKGHRFLIDAIGQLRHVDPPVCLVILGTGREDVRLKAQVKSNALGDRVRMAGFRRNVLEHLAGADILVNPSLTEGLPNVILEALCVGTPVVATNVGGTGEVVLPGHTGWLVPPGDPAAIGAAIAAALSEPSHARSMGLAGRQLVSCSYTFAHQARRWGGLFEDILRRAPTTDTTEMT